MKRKKTDSREAEAVPGTYPYRVRVQARACLVEAALKMSG